MPSDSKALRTADETIDEINTWRACCEIRARCAHQRSTSRSRGEQRGIEAIHVYWQGKGLYQE
jgi:hypothetical protein